MTSTPPSAGAAPSPASAPRRGPRNIRPADLIAYSLPLPAKVSILHRASGLLLFLLLPLVLWLFDLTLSSERSFERFQSFLASPLSRIVLVGLSWALLHHLCAGIRFLLIDLEIGVDRVPARRGAAIVLAVSLALTALAALRIFGVWS
jgi:succinate dehydrogenase / fumarate reductase cytochrome b subunit